MKNFITPLVLVLGMSGIGVAQAKDINIGVINGSDIAQKYQADIEKKITDEFKTQETQLRTLQEQLKTLSERVQKDKAVLSESELAKLKAEFEAKQDDYQAKGMAFSEQINKRRNDEFKKLLDIVNQEIEKIAKQKKYDIILQKAATAYASEHNDITKDVLVGLDKILPKQ